MPQDPRGGWAFRAFAFLLLPLLWPAWAVAAEPAPFNDEVRLQIEELQAEKAGRTPGQQKMESRLIYTVKRHAKVPFSARMEKVLQKTVQVEADGAALVDISATVTPELLGALKTAGAEGIVSVPRFRAIRARVPLGAIEKLAGRADVRFIKQAAPAFTRTGPINSQGDVAHGTAGGTGARAAFNVTGAGVKIGVLSDSVDSLASSQASGELGPVNVLDDYPGETGEGTAMLEIVHDIAPGAELFFATAYHSEASFAQNILNLRAAGCDIIIDDVGYFDESPFQNGPVAEAIEQVSADGALVFSAAGNEGNKNRGTSGTWEGDFVDGGATTAPITKAGRLHSFGGLSYNVVTATGYGETLFWADPLGASNNDYDLYVLSSDGSSIVAFSNTTQNGTQDPVEIIAQSQQPISAGQRLIIVKAASAAPRFLQVSTLRGTLTTSTNGKVSGHSACPSVISVAAVSAAAGTAFTTSNRVESFSSDGPRRFFFNTDGTPITPGNFSATGGRVLQKPDIAAADRVSTSVPGFGSFAGTSAAAPHAGAIAALLKSQNLRMTPQELRAALIANTIDIEGPGVDRDTGYGIVRPSPTLLTIAAGAKVEKVSLAITAESYLPANGAPDPGEQITVALALRNTGGATTGSVTATLLPTDGITNVSGPQTYALGGGQTDTKSFSFTANAVIGGKITLTFAIADDAVNYGTVTQSFALGTLGAPQTFSNPAKITINDYVAGNTAAAATPYPSTIDVAGFSGSVGKVTVRLNAFSHTYPGDVKVMLVSPSGTPVMLMAYGGGGTNAVSTNLTFDDAGITTFTPSVSGTYHPMDNSLGGLYGNPFPAPAPSGYYTELAAFIGNTANGTWSLYVVDDGPADVGAIDGGWTLNITPVAYSEPATAGADIAVGMTASTSVLASGQEIIYTITVANNGTADAAGVEFSDTFPAALTPTNGTITQGSGDIIGNDVTVSLGAIPAKGSATIVIHAVAILAGSFSNTASVTTTATDIDPANNSATLGGLIGTPNLTLVRPAGWSDRLVVSSAPGTNIDSGTASDPLFLDFAVGNAGTAAASAYFTMKLFVDGVLMRTIERQLALAVNGVYRVEDVALPPLGPGPHTLRVQVDTAGIVSESDETDNEYTRYIGYPAPTLAGFAPAQIPEDGALARVALNVGTAGIAPGNLAFSASSNNPALVPDANVVFGSDANGSFFSVTPLPDANGTATITITVTSGDGQKATADLALTVLSVNDAPTLAALGNLDLLEDAAAQTVNLTGISSGGETQTLTVTAVSDNPTLTGALQIAYTSPDDTGTLTFTPQADRSGVAHITVTVTDNGGTANGGVDSVQRSFTVTVAPVNDPPIIKFIQDVTVLEKAPPQTFFFGAFPGRFEADPLTFTAVSSNPELVPDPVITYSAQLGGAQLTFQPRASRQHTATITVTANDGQAENNLSTRTFLITVTPVNDAPSFVKGADFNLLEDAGPQTVQSWATQISPGPDDESDQTVQFLVSTDNPGLFSAGPSIAPNGTLSFTPTANASDKATISVRLQDSGGRANGGFDTSATQTFYIAVNAVNDPPSFTKGPDQTAAQDAGPQSIAGWAANIKAGPADEVAQALDFRVTTPDTQLFRVAPAISPDGALTYTPADKASGTATVTVALHDNGGTADGGSDLSTPQTFTIAVTTYLEETGTYNGLITAAAGLAPAHANAGLIRVQVLRSGAFTAVLRLSGRNYLVTGHFDKAGVATFGRAKLPAYALKRPLQPDLQLQLQLDVGGGSDQLTGTLADGGQPFATLVADRALYALPSLAKAPFRAVPPEILGRYTVILPAKTPQETGRAASSYPQGDGAGTLVVDTRGRATLRAYLPDGSRVVYINSLSKANTWPLYLPLYRNAGSLSGPVTFRDRKDLSDFDALDLHWFKPPSPARRYPGGWMSGLQIDLLGSKYIVTPGRSVLEPLPNPPLAAPQPGGNVEVALTGGSLAAPGLLHPLNLDARDHARSIVGEKVPLSLGLIRSTGFVAGRFYDPASRRFLTYFGYVFQKQGMASGFFLDTQESGSFVLTPKAAPAP
jgi:uncharacterized repeat protein (TIGR01451 family)